MSKEQGGANLSTPSKKVSPQSPNLTEPTTSSDQSSQLTTPPKLGDEPATGVTPPADPGDRKPEAKRDITSETTAPSTLDDPTQRPRQVIAVSASKGPAAFFNLARKFLVTDEMCDLSALEGAIVSAVDAAHLLERSKLASIVSVQTSYVTVEPKRRKQDQSPQLQSATPPHGPPPLDAGPQMQQGDPSSLFTPPTRGRQAGSSGRELRRARIVITVKRTESYKQWLEENPLQAIIASDGGGDDDDEDDEADAPTPAGTQQTQQKAS